MPVSIRVKQYPEPGKRMLLFRGDVVRFRLVVENPGSGTGWLRTNIGQGHVTRREIIAEVDENESPMHHDWFDLSMAAGENGFELILPLCEVGHFEAKCYFLPDGGQPVWPPGQNCHINVEPAESVCANTVYNAFIRQFGPNKKERRRPPADIDFEKFDAEGYTLIPPSGTFRSFKKELDFIIDELGCRYIQLLPINPTPTTYGRMGRFGSPYASQSFRLVDTALAEFDLKATPMEQFIELVDAIHSRHARVILDIAINHTGWGARLHEMYPRWLKRDEDGKIEMPGAWGVLWEDLTRLDYSRKELWRFMAMVFLTWCRRGVDGFRCDAGYMIPAPAWRYIVARVREQYPDTLFFLEGLGGKISVTRDLLNTANLNWAYSELFQNYDRGQIHHYMPEAIDISATDGVMVNFAETHDNPRLAAVSTTYAKMRTTICAMFSNSGGFAFANGVEWFATEKIDVHDANPLNWGAEVNQVDHIRRLNTILKTHPAFFDNVAQQFIERKEGSFLALLRSAGNAGSRVLILVNLDCSSPATACWDVQFPGDRREVVYDLISLRELTIEQTQGGNAILLEPGEVLCLSSEKEDMALIKSAEKARRREPQRIAAQRLKSKVLDVYRYFYGLSHMENFDPEAEAARLRSNPAAFCRSHNQKGEAPGVIAWQYPADLNRRVMVPAGHFLLISSPVYFEARLEGGGRIVAIEKGMDNDNGGCFALFSPLSEARGHRHLLLKLTLYHEKTGHQRGYVHENAHLLYLSSPETEAVSRVIRRDAVMSAPFTLLEANTIGGVCRASSWWGHLDSKYDALLAANMNPEMPDNRWIMFTRCRGWIVYQDYSQEIRTDCIREVSWGFPADKRGIMRWRYRIPTGLGLHVRVSVVVEMVAGMNRVRIHFHRHFKKDNDQLDDALAVRLILRPDIEDRSFHETTKAFTGPEQSFPQAVSPGKDGFVFSPVSDRRLAVDMAGAVFVREPEWTYMVHRPLEAERGMDPYSDLFSPGYFQGALKGGQTLVLDAMAMPGEDKKPLLPAHSSDKGLWEVKTGDFSLLDAMRRAMDHFVVDRQQLKSVIAGYPWFLDWGRDSLIFCRGLVAAGQTDTALEIIQLFGQFEENGTLPNMICGADARNRDTSDAPLWFIIACRDLAEKAGWKVLDAPCGGRTIREILFSIAKGYVRGTTNGIRVDPDTGLVFSPAHFTWMDTNFPAATPRQGFPIEIQALWYASLVFLEEVDPPKGLASETGIDFQQMAGRVAQAAADLYYDRKNGFLSDCLHCTSDTAPGGATADDALRPNQLFAITMGLINDTAMCGDILAACSELLVPGGIRSLADRSVSHPLAIYHNGQLLGDPYHPYRGRYEGDEDASRKPAYHNGTAWTWVFPSFCEGWVRVYGVRGRKAALSWLSSAAGLINEGCIGHVPEILDGDDPHVQRGCDAQAWSASELYRVLSMLQ
ncbi:MAG: amylo-alpha-1,6-glucosidase [Desulfosalsimonadaceae bacterium]